jgi:hypothetical protein
MAVQSATSRIQYAGNNSTVTSYAVPFVFLENAHLQAIARTSAGVESTVTLTNHTGAGDVNGGTVRTAVAVPVASTLTIFREVPATQTTSYQEGGDFPAASHERALDKLTQIAQQLDRKVGSAIRLSAATQLPDLNPPLTNQQHILSSVGGAAPSWQALPSLSIGPVIATGSTTARSVQDRFAEIVNVKDFGAKGDGTTDDSAAIQTAINFVASGQKVAVRIPAGTYVINGAVSVNGRFVSFDWEYPCSFIGTGTFNGYSLASTNWQFAQRIQNKLFVGSLTDANDGAMWSNGSDAFSQDWVETEIDATSSIAQMVTISDTGYLAVLGASRTSDNPLANSQGTMGVAGIVVADKVPTLGNLSSAYGLYVEARRKGNAGFCHGFEVDVISRVGSVSGSTAITTPLLHPNSVANAHALIGGWFSNSRPDITDGGDASVGIGFINNADTRTATQGRYRIGILFDQKAILGADGSGIAGTSNIGQAIALGAGHAIGWWGASSTTAPLSQITLTDTGSVGTNIYFATQGIRFTQAESEILCEIPKVTSPEGYWRFSAATSAVAAVISVVSPSSANRNAIIRSAGASSVFLASDNGTSFQSFSNANAVNYFSATGTAAGTAPVFAPVGTDTNIDMSFVPKGTGVLRFGTHAAVTTETVTGFITIKDAAGNTRKLAVVS